MNKDTKFIFKKKKIQKIIFYLILFTVVVFLSYFSIPKFLNYTPELIVNSLKKNSELNIKNISKINYRFFPSPRLRIHGSNLEIGENILEVKEAKVDIILNSLNLINYKELVYDRLLISGGSTNIRINKINKLLNFIKKNKKRINFKKNNIIVLQKNKKLFEIDSGETKIYSKNNTQQLKSTGLLLNHKVIFFFKNEPEGKSNIILKIPEFNILANISLEKKDKPVKFEGLVNFEVQNNFFQFNFIKEKNITINNGFIRNNLINSSFNGEVSFKPNFFFNLDMEPSKFKIQKLFSIIQKIYFSENPSGLEIIKKINGFLSFKSIFEGNIIFENREILFQNFKTKEANPIFFDAKITEFGKKGKVQFSLHKSIKHKNNSNKELKILGFIIPYLSKVTFEKISLGNESLVRKKIKNYEEKFNNEVVNNSLGNIFINSKTNNFIKNFVD